MSYLLVRAVFSKCLLYSWLPKTSQPCLLPACDYFMPVCNLLIHFIQLDMQDGDTLEVHQEQIGGC